jgi:hypothetical protein
MVKSHDMKAYKNVETHLLKLLKVVNSISRRSKLSEETTGVKNWKFYEMGEQKAEQRLVPFRKSSLYFNVFLKL